MKQPTQRDIQAETRRNQLLDIALVLFAERGVENVSVKDLAAEAGVAQGLIYHYFKGKDELLAAVFERQKPLAEIEAIIDAMSGLPAREGLTLFAQRLAALMVSKRAALRLLVREMLSPRSDQLAQVLAFRETVAARLTAYLQERIAAGELRPHVPLVTIQMLVSSLLTLLLLEQPIEPLIPSIVETLLDGVTAA